MNPKTQTYVLQWCCGAVGVGASALAAFAYLRGSYAMVAVNAAIVIANGALIHWQSRIRDRLS